MFYSGVCFVTGFVQLGHVLKYAPSLACSLMPRIPSL